MLRELDFYQTLVDAGLPCVGVSGSGPKCRIDFDAAATDDDRERAAEILAAFDWSDPPPLKPAATLQEMFKAAPPDQREKLWNMVLGEVMLEWCVANPDRAMAMIAEVAGQPVEIREGK